MLKGVALERIDPEDHHKNANNWHSAASTAGYGTPGYKNSQFKQSHGITATIEVVPKVFSPDNDGFDDIATIQYKTDEPGYVANITIFDAAGRPGKNSCSQWNIGFKRLLELGWAWMIKE